MATSAPSTTAATGLGGTSKAEVQALLRFLAQDAKVPLQIAMSRMTYLLKSSLTTPTAISKANVSQLTEIFQDEKLAKSVHAASRRNTKKRSTTSTTNSGPSAGGTSQAGGSPAKRAKATSTTTSSSSAAGLESSLALPDYPELGDAELQGIVLHANRAPLVLAFALAVLKRTMPEQPLSSRLSLAHAAVGANARAKAVAIGLESGPTAEQDGWGAGQPVVRVLGREVRCLKRWGYASEEDEGEDDDQEQEQEHQGAGDSGGGETGSAASTQTLAGDKPVQRIKGDRGEIPLWGLDLEALRSSNSARASGSAQRMPVHTPQSARAYLLGAFSMAQSSSSSSLSNSASSPKRKTTAAIAAEKEHNAGMLLRAIDLLVDSWATCLTREELDRRAWNWYVAVRPDVESGQRGWGGKGDISLGNILKMRKVQQEV